MTVLALAAVLCAPLLTKASADDKPKLVVFAAASMKNALDAVNKAWTAKGNPDVTVSYAASSTLANQIDKGAPADLFISADTDWMTFLKSKGRITPNSIVDLLGNRLVLITKKTEQAFAPLTIGPDFDLAARIGNGKLAIGMVDSVPVGKYGKAAMQKLGLWDQAANHIAQTDNVRAALLLVSRGEAAAGIVYATDAAADPNVTIVGIFPKDASPAIIYPVGIIAGSTNPEATNYLTFLRSAEARPLFETQGFTVLASGN